jgi:maltose O-acetyltransferase
MLNSIAQMARVYRVDVTNRCASAVQSWAVWPLRFRLVLLRLWGVQCDAETEVSPACYFGRPEVTLGKCYLNRDVYLDVEVPATITIGDGCDIGMGTLLITSHHEIGDRSRRAGAAAAQSIVIEPGSWLGARVVVLPGVTIGAGCVVAAGAVVTRDCAPDGLYAGVPARRIRDLDR